MPIIKCMKLDNTPKGYNPDIEVDNVMQIFKSQDTKGPIYIRFVVVNRKDHKIKPIDVYWVFDDFEEQIHNFKLTSNALVVSAELTKQS